MRSSLWDVIKTMYEDKYSINSNVIEYLSVRPILIRSLSGYGNYRISKTMHESIDYIRSILLDCLNFDGWDRDLDYNPIAIFNNCKGNLDYFRQEVQMYSNIENIKLIDKSFYICKFFYDNIEPVIKEYYESES